MFRPTVAKLFRNLFGRKTGTIVNGRPSRRLQVEILEDRVTPSTVVTTALDVVDPNDGLTSLREAIIDANANPAPDTITFDPALTSKGPATILLSQVGDYSFGPSALNITSNITIQGPTGANGITIARDTTAAPDRLRLFIVESGANLTLENLTIANGLAKGGDGGSTNAYGAGGGAAGFGGAIVNAGTLTLLQSTLTGNVAHGGNGGSAVGTGSAGTGGGGGLGGDGGFGSNGGGGGGGVAGPGQASFNGARGGLNTLGTQANPGANGTSGGGGGGSSTIFMGGGAGDFGGGGGGGFAADPAAGGFGGGGGGGGAETGANGGFGGGGGGGLNDAGAGGFGAGNGVTDAFSDNGGGGAGMGGAIFNYGGAVFSYNSTFDNNSAIGGDGGDGGNGGQGLGGAIFNYDPTFLSTVKFFNSTLGNNTASGAQGLGGAVFAYGGFVSFTNVTAASNTAADGGGAIYYYRHGVGGNVSLFNSILADSIGLNDFDANDSFDFSGRANIVETTPATGALAVDPNLGLLADNGGPTKTFALLSGSPAINAGNNDDAIDNDDNPFTTDQRGFDRVVADTIDIGAYEFADFDFGDAPIGYPVTLAENGAEHLATGPTLGATRTAEADGTHSADASADTGDDGITAAGPLVPGQTTNITINVQGGSGFVNAWADLNRDGDWDDPGEQFLTNLPVSVGDNTIPFSVPAGFPLGDVVVRYRLTSASVDSPSPTGILPDGEVEDYLATIQEAPSLVVTTDQDVVNNTDGLTSLREAIAFANSNPDASVITFGDGSALASGTDFTDATPDTITLGGSELEIESDVTIVGTGAQLLTIDGNNQSRVFTVDLDTTADISGLTITGGHVTNFHSGGGIYNDGTLTLSFSTLSGNSATTGGAIQNEGTVISSNNTYTGNTAEYHGGAIYHNHGTFTSTNDTITGNTAPYDGAGIAVYSTFTGVNDTIVSNQGEGIYNEGYLILSNSIVAGNSNDLDGSIDLGSHNLVGGNLSDIFATGLLADNGGPTQTIALKIGGPAINAGDDSLAVDAGGNPLTTDQRGVGFNRFVGTVDLGAFEFESSDNAAPTSTTRFPAAGGSYTAASWNAGAPIAGTAFDNGPTTINDFAIPTAPYSGPEGITAGPDGNLWFVEDNADKIAMINPATHVIQEFAIPTANSNPTGITAGADGNLWFTEYEYDAGNKIGQFNPTTHVFQEFTIPTAQSGPQSITAGPDGNLWFVEGAANKIGTIDPTTHVFQEFTIPTVNSGPDEITVGPDGNLWFTEYDGQKIGQINPTTHAFQEFDFPEGGSTGGITTGSDGNLWFGQGTRNIDQFNPTTQAFQEFTLPTPVSSPNGITAGADGNLWFAEFNVNKIGQINPTTDAIQEFTIPTAGSQPFHIAAGPDGNLWFTEAGGNKIGQVLLGSGLQKEEVSVLQVATGKYWNGASFSSDTEFFVTATGTASWSVAFPASNFPADGSYTVHARATDNAGNVESGPSATFTYNNGFDFGDAPAGYPVTLAEDGARHIATGPTLGATRTSEADGTHSADASADTGDDGVTAAGPLIVGQTTNITINVQGGSGFVNAWADLNRDGDWNDPGEQFLTNLPVSVGNNTIPFAVPAGFTPGDVVVRYRLTSASVASPSPTGLLPDGEVEDYVATIYGADFGDAPTGYPVTLAENGAEHLAVGPTLGATRTTEADGTHSADASADTGDDGVTAAGPLIVGQTTNITINVQGGSGFVNAWADLNRDGDWNDPGEQFLTNLPVSVGNNTIPFAVPAGFTPGDVVVRYRLTSASVASPSPTGLLPDGEVEDYVATIYGADFGDAPTGYPVTLAENGAEHLATGPTLGATRTTEADGTHSATASADTGDDGVTAAGPLIVGQTTNITINVQGGSGFVNAWADLNRDGDWNDPGEQFLTNLPVSVGNNTIPFAVPAGFTPGDVVVRYRLTSASVASPSPTGLLPDGEVEDYVATIYGADFGDAPTGYPVTLAENGAEHLATGPTLGATRTTEADGTHSADASADTGDDGVTAAGPLIVGQTTNITINVQGGSGFVNAWADLNRDGDWNDPGEQFLTNLPVSVGNNTIPFAVPAGFTPGDVVVRYRLTSASVASPSPTGLLPDGEVEDYVATIYGADFGDAPTGYPVTLAENGAEHLAVGPTLGATRTSEADGTHSADASADTGDDGVTAAGPLIVGQTTNITINVQGGSGFVNAWADLNRDGDWNDPGEQFLTNLPVSVGNNTIPFAVPAGFTPGDVVVRYRLTSASVASPTPTGLLPDGEVEDYVATIYGADFGDAPTGYPVTLGENGAEHLAVGPTLGATRTAEADGTHSADASADTGDDGVTAAGPLIVGQTTNITINVQGGSGFVNAWADLNRDGDWNDPGEQFLTNLPVSVGNNTIPFAVPAGFTPGDVVVRYRLTSASVASPSPTGLLPDGEVEDYVATIYPPVSITTTNLASWTVNHAGYSQTIAVTGGTGTRTFSVLSGALPPGLALDSATGAITGTPTGAGSTFTIKVTDAVGAVATRQFSVSINAAPAVGNLSQTAWTNGATGFTGTLPITGGTPGFAINSIAGLPTGLTAFISGARIAFKGAPNLNITAPKVFNCRVTVRDAVGAISAVKTFAITINPAIRFNRATLPPYTVNAPYAQTIAIGGGTGVLRVSFAISGPLPIGLTIKRTSPTSNVFIISGRPMGTGAVTITLTVVDSLGVTTRLTLTLMSALDPRRRGA